MRCELQMATEADREKYRKELRDLVKEFSLRPEEIFSDQALLGSSLVVKALEDARKGNKENPSPGGSP